MALNGEREKSWPGLLHCDLDKLWTIMFVFLVVKNILQDPVGVLFNRWANLIYSPCSLSENAKLLCVCVCVCVCISTCMCVCKCVCGWCMFVCERNDRSTLH